MKLLSTLLWLALALSSAVSHAAPVTRFIHNDALGSPVAATDQNGDVVWKEEYKPFGERIIKDGNADTQKRWFTGHVQDSDTGLVYMGARFYDPSIGRFVSPDPVGFSPNAPMMFNRYAYANNNPYKYIDPDGRAPNQAGTTDASTILSEIQRYERNGLNSQNALSALSKNHGSNTNRYFYTDKFGWVDVRHFGKAAELASSLGSVTTEALGFGNEVVQWFSEGDLDYSSGFSPEDISSNAAGAQFGDDFVSSGSLSKSFSKWMKEASSRNANDPKSGRSKLPATDPSVRGGVNRGSSNMSNSNGPGAQKCPSGASSCS